MPPSLSELLARRDDAGLTRLVQERWGIAPTPEALRWLHEIASRPTAHVGGTPDSPWSESTWLTWIKNRLDAFASNPARASDPFDAQAAPFEVERDPASPAAWRSFLERFSEELLAVDDLELWTPIPDEARAMRWMGFEPAAESRIQAAEARLGRRLPPSLRAFYSVSNGWRATGYNIYGVLPVEGVGRLSELEPFLYQMAVEAAATPGPFPDDPGDVRLNAYRDEEGIRPMRCLVVSSGGNNGDTWALDPGADPHAGEWPAGGWSEASPGWAWDAANFAELMADAMRALRD
jgi:hypothetical protein